MEVVAAVMLASTGLFLSGVLIAGALLTVYLIWKSRWERGLDRPLSRTSPGRIGYAFKQAERPVRGTTLGTLRAA